MTNCGATPDSLPMIESNFILGGMLALNIIVVIVGAIALSYKNRWMKSVNFSLEHILKYVDQQEESNNLCIERHQAQDIVNKAVLKIIKENKLG
jgi:hypothetical protein